ncbi:hypothetical protein IQ277_28245 [Nostocales cyanobacterium LEGE 12452]|nr:hypothetical protein [Nostocales cyanobacterium LEGE 12452]
MELKQAAPFDGSCFSQKETARSLLSRREVGEPAHSSGFALYLAALSVTLLGR